MLGILLASISSASAQYKMQSPAGEAPGPWLLGTIGIGKGEGSKPKSTVLKGLAIKLGENGEVGIVYDLDLCRVAGAWTGGKFVTPMNLMSRGEYPTVMGDVAFSTGDVPGFVEKTEGGNLINEDTANAWKDPRPEPLGPLPAGKARFKGFYVNGNKTILKWEIGGTEVLEMPTYLKKDLTDVYTRVLHISAAEEPLLLLVGRVPPGTNERDVVIEDQADWIEGTRAITAIWEAHAAACLWKIVGGNICLEIPPHQKAIEISIALCTFPEVAGPFQRDGFDEVVSKLLPRDNVQALLGGGPARWPDPIVTEGKVAHPPFTDHQSPSAPAYVVDTIKLPDPNPWDAPMFIGGFDFFPDGRAAVCTFHGDVFIVSGIDEKLEKVTWKRFASGLYHALGLKIVDGKIYVTCRDGIWRLNDLNGDGECDFYEPFNFDLRVTKSFHEFVFDLQTDPQGNFYFAKAGPVKNGGRGFDEIMSQHGTLMKVSPDGSKLEVVATGFRAPNGIGVGPHGELTSGDNEGTWTPACKINWIKPGSFYGVVPLAHRETPPTIYDPPLCWLPKRVDNSGGSQVWVPDGDDRWGPWRGHMLHLSYGQSSLYGVLMEEMGAGENVQRSTSNVQPSTVMQGGVVKFPLKFDSGIMRARFNPVDGQLYVAGLRGWQTNGAEERLFPTGALHRGAGADADWLCTRRKTGSKFNSAVRSIPSPRPRRKTGTSKCGIMFGRAPMVRRKFRRKAVTSRPRIRDAKASRNLAKRNCPGRSTTLWKSKVCRSERTIEPSFSRFQVSRPSCRWPSNTTSRRPTVRR